MSYTNSASQRYASPMNVQVVYDDEADRAGQYQSYGSQMNVQVVHGDNGKCCKNLLALAAGITFLVLGILGAQGVVHMHFAGALTMVALGGAIVTPKVLDCFKLCRVQRNSP